MLMLAFKANAPMEEAQGAKERIAMALEQLGYRDIQCVEVREEDPPEQLRMGR